jgi:hypothetical protein
VKEIYMQAYYQTRNENKETVTCRYQNKCEEIEAPVEGQSPANKLRGKNDYNGQIEHCTL